MRTRIAVCTGIFLATVAVAQSDCPSKVKDEQSHNCELFNSKPDTARLIFRILFTRPHFSEENTPENRAKLRKWTDSLYRTFDLRYINVPDERAEPPSDSLMDWVTYWLYAKKSDGLSIAALDFISQVSYRDKPPSVVFARPGNLERIQGDRPSELFDINGRFIRHGGLKTTSGTPKKRMISRNEK